MKSVSDGGLSGDMIQRPVGIVSRPVHGRAGARPSRWGHAVFGAVAVRVRYAVKAHEGHRDFYRIPEGMCMITFADCWGCTLGDRSSLVALGDFMTTGNGFLV